MSECEQNEPNSDFVLKTPYFESQSYLKQNLKTVMYRKFYNNRQSYVESNENLQTCAVSYIC
jgi:hypothetical protein